MTFFAGSRGCGRGRARQMFVRKTVWALQMGVGD